MNENKIKIIDSICERHPGLGLDKGWSWYVGGMTDSGGWHYRKMLDCSEDELQQFLNEIIKAEKEPYEPVDAKTQIELLGELKRKWERKLLFG